MARNIQVNTIIGTYADGTDLIAVMRSTLAADLSAVGITGEGLPNIHIIGVHGASTSGISMKLSNISKISSIPGMFWSNEEYPHTLDIGVYSDNLHIPINTLVLATDTPSASATLRLNYYFEPC